MIRKVDVQGVDVELIDRSESGAHGLLIPDVVRVNGAEIAIPKDASVQVSEINSHSIPTVTITMFVRSLAIRHEPPSATDS